MKERICTKCKKTIPTNEDNMLVGSEQIMYCLDCYVEEFEDEDD